MFGIERCSGGEWGVFFIVDTYELAQEVVNALSVKNGRPYKIKRIYSESDKSYINEVLNIKLY